MSRLSSAIKALTKMAPPHISAGPQYFYKLNPNVIGGLSSRVTLPSRSLIDRLKHFYRSNHASVKNDGSMWVGIDELRSPIHFALLSDNGDALELLSDPSKTFLCYGFDSIVADANLTHPDIGVREYDTLIRLSEALGLRRLYYSESADPQFTNLTPDEELELIFSHLGIVDAVIPNPFINAQGLVTTRGILDYRSLQSIYQASRLQKLKPMSVVEIGGGLGRTAAFSLLMGVRRYTIIDIPLTIVAQALFLGATFGENQIRLSGERDTGQSVQLLNPGEFQSVSYDVVLNVDSMTEIGRENASAYLDIIRANAKPFISINHEHNSFTVHELLGTPFHRYPYWMRHGYTEEFYPNS